MGDVHLGSQTELVRQIEFLNGLIDSVSDIMFCKDAEGRYIGCNKAFAERVGRVKDEIVGRTDFDLFPREDAESYRRDDRATLARNKCLCVEETILYPNGLRVMLEICKTPYQGSDGQLRGLIGVGRDITIRKQSEEQNRQLASGLQQIVAERTRELVKTNGELLQEVDERKRSENALKENEERYRALFDRSNDIVYIHGFDGHFIDANPAALRLTGYEKAELPSLNLIDVIDPSELPVVEKTLRELKEKGAQEAATELRIKRKNGEYVILETKASVIERDGFPFAIQGIARDVTEQRRSENFMIAQRDLGIALDGASSLQDALRLCLDTAIRVSGLDSGGIYITDPATGDFDLAYHMGLTDGFAKSVRHIPANSDRARLGMAGKTVYLEEGHTPILKEPDLIQEGLKSIAVIPICSQNRVVGDMNIASHILDKIPPHGRNALETVAAQIGMSIMKAKAEEELRWKTAFLEAQVEATIDGILVVDSDGKRILVNRNFLDLWNVPRHIREDEDDASLLRYVVSETAHPDQFIERVRNLYDHPDETGRDEIELKNGRVLDRHSSPVLGKDGKYYGRIWTFRDITEHKRVLKELRESQQKLSDIIDFLPDATLVVDKEGRIIAWNKAIEEMTGVPAADMLGKGDYEYALPFHGDRRPVLIDSVLNSLKEPEAPYTSVKRRDWVLEAEAYIPNLRGRESYLFGVASALKDSKGNVVGAIESIRDITDRKVLKSRLRQAQKMEAIGTLAGGIAHDFNNILSAVIGYAQLALTEPGGDDRHRSYIEQIYKAGQRAGDLVKQILTFSRQTDEKLRPLRVSPIVAEVLKLLRASLPTTVEVRQSIQSDPDTVLASPTHIHQILMNLCTNAAHAMRNKKGILNVTLGPVQIRPGDGLAGDVLTPGAHLKLSVCDTGQGIEPEVIEKIYNPFFTTKKPGEGTGMGLSVVHGIVMDCRGAITVQSEVGKGTEFNVYLPLLIDAKEKKEETAVAPIVRGNERILFVDDEEILINLGKEMLTGLGYQVIGRTNSLEALELFRAVPNQFDLVITDMTMPNLTGIELAQKLMLIRPNLPVILCTGFSEEITPQKAEFLGMRDFVMKPIVLVQMAAAIRRIFDQKNSSGG